MKINVYKIYLKMNAIDVYFVLTTEMKVEIRIPNGSTVYSCMIEKTFVFCFFFGHLYVKEIYIYIKIFRRSITLSKICSEFQCEWKKKQNKKTKQKKKLNKKIYQNIKNVIKFNIILLNYINCMISITNSIGDL